MNQDRHSHSFLPFTVGGAPGQVEDEGPISLIRSAASEVWRHKFKLFAWIVLVAVLAALYARTLPLQYTASASLLIQPRPSVGVSSEGFDPAPLDSMRIETEMQVLNSQRLLKTVFDRYPEQDILQRKRDASETDALEREGRPFFTVLDRGIAQLRSLFLPSELGGPDGAQAQPPVSSRTGAAPSDQRAALLSFADFVDRVGVWRIGQSYVVGVSFTSRDPIAAERITNAIASAYLLQSLELKLRAAESGDAFLQGRITSLQEQVKTADIAVANGVAPQTLLPDADARIIGQAIEPLSASAPKPKLIAAFAVVLALITGLAAVFVARSFNHTIRNENDVRRNLGLPVFAVVSKSKVVKGPSLWRHAASRKARSAEASDASFRRLRTTVLSFGSVSDRSLGKVVAVSGLENEPRIALVALRLAQAFRSQDKTTTLIDASLGSSKNEGVEDADANSSLADVLTGRHDFTRTRFIDFHGVRALPANSHSGMRNRQADPGNGIMKDFVDHVRREGHVVIEMPGFNRTGDAAVIARLADVVVFVVVAERTRTETLRRAIESDFLNTARNLGVVLFES